MKFVWALTVLLAGLLDEVSPCEPPVPVICYTDDNCGSSFVISNRELTLQDCFTGTPTRRLQEDGLPHCFGGGSGPGGGPGGSCECTDAAGETLCAIFSSVQGSKLTLKTRPITDPDAEKSDKTLILDCNVWSGMMGEPHIKTWAGDWYDWQGECDAVLLHAPGLGLDIHTRTKIQNDYSYIETAAIRIGDEIFEVSGYGEYYLNGVGQADMPSEISNHVVTYEMVNKKEYHSAIELGHGVSLTMKTHKDYVSVGITVDAAEVSVSDFAKWFTNSTGLMGSFEDGSKLARDGVTVMDDPNDFGQEWQVRDSEPKLFQQDRDPQYPHKCWLPSASASQVRRRLGASVSMEAAKHACSAYNEENARARCIQDVIATGDLGLASVQAF